MGVHDSVHVCDYNGKLVHMCGLRKGDQSGGLDIGDLGRNLGRALGKVALQSHPGEVDYGYSGEGHTVEVGMGRGCL